MLWRGQWSWMRKFKLFLFCSDWAISPWVLMGVKTAVPVSSTDCLKQLEMSIVSFSPMSFLAPV